MQRLVTRRSFSPYIFIILSIVFAALAWGVMVFFFPAIGGSGAVVITKKESAPAHNDPKPVAKVEPPAPVVLPPDYTLPPILGGMDSVATTLATKQDVVFLGIDDGEFKDQSVVDIMRQNNIKASLFLSKRFIAGNPDFFKQLVTLGSVVEDHTLSHDTKMTTTQDYAQQKSEICGMADYVTLHYGRRPTLFRPPGGAYSATMRKAAADCGMKAVVTWIAKANGGSMQYQIGHTLRAGDIVLMHFRPEFKQDMQAFVDAEKAAGLHTELLENAP